MLSNQDNSAVVTQNPDGTLSIGLDVGPGVDQIDLEPLQGPTGPPGLPQFPLKLMSDVFTDPKDLPNDLVNNNADIGKFWLISISDATGVILSAAFIWFGTEFRVLHFGSPGPEGPYGVIKPYVKLLPPDNTSLLETVTGGGTDADPYRFTLDLSIPHGPAGESCPLFNMPDVEHDVPPVTGEMLTYTGETVSVNGSTLPVWEPTNGGDFTPLPYIVPSKAFRSYSGVTFDKPTHIVTFPIPPNPFPWKPLVFGQIEMQGSGTQWGWWSVALPDQIGVIVILGDPDPEVGTLVGRGFGNAAGGIVTIVPHCSVPDSPLGQFGAHRAGLDSIAMTPWNTVGEVPANHTGHQGTLYVLLVNEGKQYGQSATFDFNVRGSSLFVLACPMTSQQQMYPPLYGGLNARVKLSATIGA
jgi:hypothetical protein